MLLIKKACSLGASLICFCRYENDPEAYKRKVQDVISELNNRIYEDTDTEDPHVFRLDITHDFFFSGDYVKGSFSAYAIF